jgi:uncharacterized membrane protein YdjX (TVP38/TMEM64 family)
MKLTKSTLSIKIGAVLLLLALCGVIYLLNPNFFSTLWQVLLSGDMQQTIDYIQQFGPWAMFFSFWLVLFVNAIGFPPAIIFSAANALIFGILPGIILSWIAETVGVTLSFLLMRFLFRDAAEGLIAKHAALKKIDTFSGKNGFKAMLLARTVPYFPSGVLNALGAVSQISLLDYVLASLIGKLPSTALEAIIGHDAVTVGQNSHRLMVVVVLAFLIILGFWLYNRYNGKKKTISDNE